MCQTGEREEADWRGTRFACGHVRENEIVFSELYSMCVCVSTADVEAYVTKLGFHKIPVAVTGFPHHPAAGIVRLRIHMHEPHGCPIPAVYPTSTTTSFLLFKSYPTTFIILSCGEQAGEAMHTVRTSILFPVPISPRLSRLLPWENLKFGILDMHCISAV